MTGCYIIPTSRISTKENVVIQSHHAKSMHLIVCSTEDLASQNIKTHLIEILDPEERKLSDYVFYDAGKI